MRSIHVDRSYTTSIKSLLHSFHSRRPAYYWLCNALDVYCPVQWEYGRLNLNYNVVSKRKILKLIQAGIVSGWDDPRLITLTALRRRGFPPEAVNTFCERVGVTMSQTSLDPSALEACVRDYLNDHAPRVLAVLEPLKVTITNWSDLYPGLQTKELDVPDFPADPNSKTRKVFISPELYLDSTDFQEVCDKGYRRLTPNQPVGLRYAGLVLELEQVVKDDYGKVTELKVTGQSVQNAPKPKAFIQWVCSPIPCEVRLYDRLFTAKDPDNAKDGFLSVVNPDSLCVIPNAMVEPSLKGAPVYSRYQFERIGFFAVDQDSTSEKVGLVYLSVIPHFAC
ncbi:unnamed protein product [Dicrocoelium dendriticum]|nr:unnamed protein product [Dicrocoelium dendriticum]